MSRPLSGKRIGLLTAFASPRGGGVAEAVAAQARMIHALGAEAMMFALDDGRGDAARGALAPTRLSLATIMGPKQVGYAPGQLGQLLDAGLDLLHLHGVWMHPSRVGAQWARATGRPYAISPHGMLDPWITARGRWKKALARRGYERSGWAAASAFHALTLSEARDIARETGRGDALVIANAGPAAAPAPSRIRPPELLYLGRIHPKKNLAGLIGGWRQTRRPVPARLRIAGWGADRDVEELRRLLAEVGDPTIEFVGPAFGEAKQRLLEAARFLILPSFSEGLPMVALEAWAAGTPALLSQGCNLPEGYAAGAALDCGTSPAEVAAALERAFAVSDAAWLKMAAAAHELAVGRFSAATISGQWEDAYAALLAGGRRG
ncbi:MAG: glycosyltransferase [Novosphingobium sp.]|nr:glycosyltransferase [Novosphingobium sp.]